MNIRILGWAIFALFVLGAIAFDLGLLRRSTRNQREPSVRAAALRSAGWIALAFLLGLGVTAFYGRDAVITYLTAYLPEELLSLHTIFVFVLIFSQLRSPQSQQP